MKPLTVIVTDASYKHSVGLIRSLGTQGHRVTAVSHSRFAPGKFSRYRSDAVSVANPACEPEQFVSDLSSYCRQHSVDLIIPVGYSSYSALSHYQILNSDLPSQMLIPAAHQFDFASDKWEMSQFVRSLGVAAPDAVLASDSGSIGYFLKKHPRVVLTHRRESLGKGAEHLASGIDRQMCHQELIRKLLARDPEQSILQEYVPGHGVGYMALCVKGIVVREYTHRRVREWPPDGGYATAAVTTDDPAIKQIGRGLLTAMAWNGPAMVEFRSGEKGTYFIEFNPKFWGSLELGLAAGADFSGDLCRWRVGEDLQSRPVPSYRVGLRYWWPWRGDLRRLLRRPSDSISVLHDLASPASTSNWWWRDPAPNLIEIGGELLYPLRRHD